MFAKMLLSAAILLSSLAAMPAPTVVPASASKASAVESGKLTPGATLRANQSIYSTNRSHVLTQQSDGNLVFYKTPRTPIWSTHTIGQGHRTVMQTDGNLVVLSATNEQLFETRTSCCSGSWLAIENDGRLILYSADNRVLWSP